MTTYYIDPSAGVNGNGALATPFNTWASVTWASGNTYLQKAGTTYNGAVTVSVGGSSEATRVYVGTYNADGSILQGTTNRAKLNGGGTRITLRVSVVNYVTIDSLEVYGTDGTGGSSARAVYFGSDASNTANYCNLFRCYIHDVSAALFPTAENNGLQVFGSNCRIEDNLIENIPVDGMWIQGSNNRIYRNTVRNVSTATSSGDCIQINGDTTLRNDNTYIGYNDLDHSAKNSKQVIISGGIGYSSNSVIEYNNTIMAAYDSVISTTCIFTEAENSIIRGNTCEGGYFGIFVNSSAINSIVHGNLCTNNQRGIGTHGSTTGTTVVNNTVVDSVLHGVHIDTDTTAIVKNNVIYSCEVGVAMETGENEDYNCYYGNTTAKATLGGVAAWGSNSITSDPLVLSNYSIPQNSPCAAAGVFVSLDISDREGRRFHYPPTIGAFECLYQHIERLGDNGAITYAVGNPDLTMPTIGGAGYLQNRVAKIIADGTANATSSRLTLEGKLRAKVGGG